VNPEKPILHLDNLHLGYKLAAGNACKLNLKVR